MNILFYRDFRIMFLTSLISLIKIKLIDLATIMEIDYSLSP